MNHKQQVAAMHARDLRIAKDDLLIQINSYINKVSSEGGRTEITPQLSRLVNLDKYRARDVAKIQQLVSNPDKLQEYIYAENAAGYPISGEKAVERYVKAVESGFVRPAKEKEIMVDNVAETMRATFVDESALNEFQDFLRHVMTDPSGSIDESWWRIAHSDWYTVGYRGSHDYGKAEMLKENASNVFEMQDALRALIERDGIQKAAQRIKDNYEVLQEQSIKASIGYKGNAADGLQQVLRILLPEDRQPGNIRHRIADMQEVYEGQFDNEE